MGSISESEPHSISRTFKTSQQRAIAIAFRYPDRESESWAVNRANANSFELSKCQANDSGSVSKSKHSTISRAFETSQQCTIAVAF